MSPVMFSEVTEVRDAVHLLSARAKDEEVAQALIREMDWYDRYLERGHSDRSAVLGRPLALVFMQQVRPLTVHRICATLYA